MGKKGRRFAVWRCASRINHGTKYCHDSPALREEPLQAAILAAVNPVMSQQEALGWDRSRAPCGWS
ncbi:recombinase zinc beta ribbon domain-containing protein [uncultured Oscillibacter sp.]|uniref:recombinase zinc beta ribbon domain-containing protein n=1 Tax=uncultured Oscillibacter sp. TaxID=876091 RepID=UPI0025FAEA29|nr:recombinase zinc beta ribbon domain-containing protein [uncultured Oscillibacter sp.]